MKPQEGDAPDTRKDHSRHLIDTRIVLANDMAIKAFFYGEDIVQELVADFNYLMAHGRRRTQVQGSGLEADKFRHMLLRPIPQSSKNGQSSHLMKIPPISGVSPSGKAQNRGRLKQLNLEYAESVNSAFKTQGDDQENDRLLSRHGPGSVEDSRYAFNNF